MSIQRAGDDPTWQELSQQLADNNAKLQQTLDMTRAEYQAIISQLIGVLRREQRERDLEKEALTKELSLLRTAEEASRRQAEDARAENSALRAQMKLLEGELKQERDAMRAEREKLTKQLLDICEGLSARVRQSAYEGAASS